MSYASVVAHDAPSSSEQVCTHEIQNATESCSLYTPQPHPDTALLTTERSSASNVIDDTSKVNVVSSNFKENPATYTSDTYVPEDVDDDHVDPGRKAVKSKRNRRLLEAQAEGIYLWKVTKHYLFRPGVAGGLIGLGTVTFTRISVLVNDVIPK
jgi:hypothetical protein